MKKTSIGMKAALAISVSALMIGSAGMAAFAEDATESAGGVKTVTIGDYTFNIDTSKDPKDICKQPLSADSRAAFPGQFGPY